MSYQIHNEDTIAAICTAIATNQGGIAIIRISGPKAKQVGKNIISTPHKKKWVSHEVMHGYAWDKQEEEKIDEVLVFLMEAPRSFTGEDVVEIHCHGGLIAVQRVLKIVLDDRHIRRALPGEFSLRAVLNGKINLTQAESIHELISARSAKAAKLAMAGVDGGIQNQINILREKLLDQLSELEARVDFEDELPQLNVKEVLQNINLIKQSLILLVENSKNASLLTNGLNVAIIGRPNVGKSSLLNRLSKRERAIVTNVPGTTRDLLESEILLNGVPIKLIDTAGIRETTNEVEKLGIEQSHKALMMADLIIIVFDISCGWLETDQNLFLQLPKETPKFIVGNKSDLINHKIREDDFTKSTKSDVIYSAYSGEGEERLIKKLLEKCGASDIQSLQLALNERQRDLAYSAATSLTNLEEVAKQKLPWDFWTIDLREAIHLLNEITGEEITENILNRIFSRFCIGK